MTKTCKILGLFFLLLFLTRICIGAEEKVTINTYFPAPSLSYPQVDTITLKSYSTEVGTKFEKTILGSKSLQILPTPIAVNATNFPAPIGNYSSFIETPIYFALTNQNQALHVLSTSLLDESRVDTRLKVNKVLNVSSFKNRSSTDPNLVINAWPGPGQCQNFSSFFVFGYTADCPNNSFLADISETPGIYLALGVGGASATLGLGIGVGLKMAVVNYTCCEISGTNAVLTGAGTITKCPTQTTTYNTRRDEMYTAQQAAATKLIAMTNSGCCNGGGTRYDEVNPSTQSTVTCTYTTNWGTCPPPESCAEPHCWGSHGCGPAITCSSCAAGDLVCAAARAVCLGLQSAQVACANGQTACEAQRVTHNTCVTNYWNAYPAAHAACPEHTCPGLKTSYLNARTTLNTKKTQVDAARTALCNCMCQGKPASCNTECLGGL